MTWENLLDYYKSSPLSTNDDDLILTKKNMPSVEDIQISEVTNENMNKGISDENNTNRILIDLPKSYTPKKTKNAVC